VVAQRCGQRTALQEAPTGKTAEIGRSKPLKPWQQARTERDQLSGGENAPSQAVFPQTPKGTFDSEVQEGYVFIAMPMDPGNPQLEDVHDAIKEACSRCGLIAERIDEAQSNERITDRILESILRAQYVVVDLTHARPNVFYEAGFAQGNGKTPIYIARSGTPSEFDLKDYPIIYFESLKQLKGRLEERLRALA
jgi:hypothetical protein